MTAFSYNSRKEKCSLDWGLWHEAMFHCLCSDISYDNNSFPWTRRLWKVKFQRYGPCPGVRMLATILALPTLATGSQASSLPLCLSFLIWKVRMMIVRTATLTTWVKHSVEMPGAQEVLSKCELLLSVILPGVPATRKLHGESLTSNAGQPLARLTKRKMKWQQRRYNQS